MLRVSVGGVNLHYQQHGRGVDVVLVHGVTSNLAYWVLTVLPQLAARYRVTIYDMRGHGFSEVPSTGYTSGDLADELLGLMDALGIARAHVAGHSFGGVVAAHLAARHPGRLRSLVVCDAAFPALRPYAALDNWPLRGRLERELARFGVRLLAGDPDRWNLAKLLPRLARVPMWHGLRRGLPRHEGRLRRLLEHTTCLQDLTAVGDLTEERLGEIVVPTLALYSELSPFLSHAAYLERHLCDARVLVLAGGDHFFPTSAPEGFGAPILAHFAAADGVAALAD